MSAAAESAVPGTALSQRAKLEILFATLLALFMFALDRRSSARRCRASSPSCTATSCTRGRSRSTC